MRSLAISLIDHGKIKTTEAKAKELRPFVEKLITKGREDSVAARRLVVSRLGGNKVSTKKIFDELPARYKKRDGGYTRIVKLTARGGDASKMAVIELV